MNVRVWNLGDLTKLSPYAPTPIPPADFGSSDLVVLAVDASQWLLFKLVGILSEAGVGAVAVPAPGGAVVVWTSTSEVGLWTFVTVAQMARARQILTWQEPLPPFMFDEKTTESNAAPLAPPCEPADAESEEQVDSEPNANPILVSISAWNPNTEKLAACLDDIGVSCNFVVGPIPSDLVDDAGVMKLGDRELHCIRVTEAFDISVIAETIENALRAKEIPAGSAAVVNITGASKWIWKALEHVAVNLFNDFRFVGYELASQRKQISDDGVEWRWEPMTVVPETNTEELKE